MRAALFVATLLSVATLARHTRAAEDPTGAEAAAAKSAESANTSGTRRYPWLGSRVRGSPQPPPPYVSERVFPALKFQQPVHILPSPCGKRLYVTHRSGLIVSFPDQDDARQWANVLNLDVETYSMAFHPAYPRSPYVYVFTNTTRQRQVGQPVLNQILRFEWTADDPPVARPESRLVVLEYPSDGHNGGDLTFGPDGMLYITSGDGTGDSDGWNTGQDITDLTSAILRIDVDRPAAGANYSVPDDNPFVELPGARPEIWAFGFRNPWRFSFDHRTSELYVGDVGQDLWEMVWLVRRGGNYGWSVMEGGHPFHPQKTPGPTPILPPLVVHHHREARSVTGGIVYRGSLHQPLDGAYLYGDYETGKIWGLRQENVRITWHELLADTQLRPCSFTLDSHGRFLMLDHDRGEIHQLAPAPAADDTGPFPTLLSETGIFRDTRRLLPAAGVVPYAVSAPQWHDGAVSQRLIAVPGHGQIEWKENASWVFPEGTVLVKTVSMSEEAGQDAPTDAERPLRDGRRLETQIMTLQRGEWYGYSYVWNGDQTDAELAAAEGGWTSSPANSDDGTATGFRWQVASRTECMFCHSRAAGFVLGVKTEQLNRVAEPPLLELCGCSVGTEANQLELFASLGLTAGTMGSPDQLARLWNPDDASSPVADRARSYLHANCSHCHTGAGGGNAAISLAMTVPLADTKAVGGRPLHGDFGLSAAMLIAPGAPERSVLLSRLGRRGPGQMPPVATTAVDRSAVELLQRWIKTIEIPPSDLWKIDRDVAETQAAGGFLSRWYVAGPMPRDAALRVAQNSAQPPVEPLSAGAPSDQEQQNAGGPVESSHALQAAEWRTQYAQGGEGELVIASADRPADDAHWLARTDLLLSAAADCEFIVESSDQLQLAIDGKWLTASSTSPPSAAQHSTGRYDVHLSAGLHRVLAQMYAATPGRSAVRFRAAFRRKSSNPRHEHLLSVAMNTPGNPQRGKELFFDAQRGQCAKCHQIQGEGGRVGPDLTGVADRFAVGNLVEAILSPSASVAPQYRSVTVQLNDGRTRTGIPVLQDTETLTLGDVNGQLLAFSRSAIELERVEPASLMPEGIADHWTDEEFADLVAFLLKPAVTVHGPVGAPLPTTLPRGTSR